MQNVNEYIQSLPAEVGQILQRIREVVHQAAPEVEECISYNMPTFRQHGVLLHIAAHKHHIGLYPAPTGVAKLESKIAKYKHSKGTLRFALNKPVPYDLIAKIVRFRVGENFAKTSGKKPACKRSR